MCGIAGIINSIDKKEISNMLNEIKSRGEYVATFNEISNSILGNILLGIVDGDEGKQPIYNADKSLAIVYNGEIYNYKELKESLEKKGYIFRTKTDTEVILFLYEEYQEQLFDKLDGMFAFVIYDKNKTTYLAGRDPYGIKPLYYSNIDDKFYFSSELKSLTKVNCSELKELLPGFFIKNGKLQKWYLGIDNVVFKENIEYELVKKKVKKLLENAVKKRVDTNLPIAVFFSGGIDSTIILHLANKFHRNVLAVIIGHREAEDTIHSIRYCKENNIKFKQIDFTEKELTDIIPEVIYRIETFEPNPVRGATLSYLLSKATSELGYRIAICGEGSDEIFAGYGDFLEIDDSDFLEYQIKLMKDLYRTQLQRVDRTAMGFKLEVRVPFLDTELVEFALSLPINLKINQINNKKTTKFILREAFKSDIPNYIYERKKMTLMKGAGAGKVNRGSGVFYNFANKQISENEYKQLKKNFPSYNLQDKEVAYYFNIFKKYYLNAKFAQRRTTNALIEINGD